MKTKIQSAFVDEGLGFKVRITNAPMIKVRNAWTPHIDYNALSETVLRTLSGKVSRLTGAEVQFIRQYFAMTLQAFAFRFSVTHAAVIKWERAKSKPTAMAWTTEKDLRLFILTKLNAKPKELYKLYADLEKQRVPDSSNISVDGRTIAAKKNLS